MNLTQPVKVIYQFCHTEGISIIEILCTTSPHTYSKVCLNKIMACFLRAKTPQIYWNSTYKQQQWQRENSIELKIWPAAHPADSSMVREILKSLRLIDKWVLKRVWLLLPTAAVEPSYLLLSNEDGDEKHTGFDNGCEKSCLQSGGVCVPMWNCEFKVHESFCVKTNNVQSLIGCCIIEFFELSHK